MHAHITDPEQPEWEDMVRMGEDLAPSHPLFAAPHDAQAMHDDAVYHAPEHDHDHVPFETADSDSLPAAPPLPVHKNLGGYHFDFNLTGPRAHEDPPHDDQAEPHVGAVHARVAPADHDWSGTEDGHSNMLDAAPLADTFDAPAGPESEPVSTWNFDEPEAKDAHADAATAHEYAADAPVQEFGQFSDDPVDTKLDLARAYMDMGDAEGARAMLEEVQQEGNQMQRDAARHLLENIH
jgi:pilus assembly protein FimV